MHAITIRLLWLRHGAATVGCTTGGPRTPELYASCCMVDITSTPRFEPTFAKRRTPANVFTGNGSHVKVPRRAMSAQQRSYSLSRP